MNLETDREIKEKKEDKFDISNKELKEIYKESKKNINITQIASSRPTKME